MKTLLYKEQRMENCPYRSALLALGEAEERVVVLGADLANSTEIDGFRDRFPERFFNVGAAEQNAIAIAAGLAFEGEIPFVHSFGVFVTRRPYEQVCVSVAMHRANVKIIGVVPGLTSRLGPTHQAVDDLSLMRTLPGMVVIDPADATEITKALPAVAAHDGPVYMRMMRREVPALFDPASYEFHIGKAVVMAEGTDVALISSGILLGEALKAKAILEDRGIHLSLLHMPTIKPLDREALIDAAARAGAVVTLENHLITGGLGSAVAEVLCEECPVPLIRIGLADTFAEPGSPDYLFEKYHMTAADVVSAVMKALEKKRGA
jgi:transketolase